MDYSNIFKRVLLESKDRFIDRNESLTDIQKQEIKAFFNKYPNYESHPLIRDKWQKGNWDYDTFVQIKSDLKDIQDEIYSDLQTYPSDLWDMITSDKDLDYYIPYNYHIQQEVFQKKCPSRWCIGADITEGKEWNQYTLEDKSIFVDIVGKDDLIVMQLFEDGRVLFWNRRNKCYGYNSIGQVISDIESGTFTFKENDGKVYEGYCELETEDSIISSDERKYASKLDADALRQINDSFEDYFYSISDNIEPLSEFDYGLTFIAELVDFLDSKFPDTYIDSTLNYTINLSSLTENEFETRLYWSKDSEITKGEFISRIKYYLTEYNVKPEIVAKLSEENIEDIEIKVSYGFQFDDEESTCLYCSSILINLNSEQLYFDEDVKDWPNCACCTDDEDEISSAMINVLNLLEIK